MAGTPIDGGACISTGIIISFVFRFTAIFPNRTAVCIPSPACPAFYFVHSFAKYLSNDSAWFAIDERETRGERREKGRGGDEKNKERRSTGGPSRPSSFAIGQRAAREIGTRDEIIGDLTSRGFFLCVCVFFSSGTRPREQRVVIINFFFYAHNYF